MKILGVGLSKTGTSSLYQALRILGFKSIHFDRLRLNDILNGSTPNPNFRRYDDVDAVIDLPAAYFYRKLLQAYPESKAILTIRDVDSWWRSMSIHTRHRFPVDLQTMLRVYMAIALHRMKLRSSPETFLRFRINLRNCVYGSATPNEFLYKKNIWNTLNVCNQT